ncbi:MAG: hypothetical protein HOQ24_08605 [Mycobacteriaceae bacterium]|nr:hypothetical protein [Mycobacteriaceae bacterium]
MKKRTSFNLDDHTRDAISRHADEADLTQGEFIQGLVARYEMGRQLAVDAEELRKAGLWDDQRLDAVNQAAAASRRTA